MANVEEKIRHEITDLVEIGGRILQISGTLGSPMKGDDLAKTTAWVTRLGQAIRRLYGDQSQPLISYSQALGTEAFYIIHSNHNEHIAQLVGIATAIQHDLDQGLLFNVRTLMQADVFADFLEMAEYLLSEGYKDAAAVLVGAVLEDKLRKLCEKESLPITNTSGRPLTIDPMNVALAKHDVYNKLIQKQITTWAHVRNKAAHGEYGEYSQDEVKMMLLFTQGFTADYTA